MPLPDPKSHRIPLTEAAEQTRRRAGGKNKGGMFLRKELDELLAQPGCSGLRFYHGQDTDGADTLVLVGVDQEGNDMVSGVLLDGHFPCPPFCGGGNSLNT